MKKIKKIIKYENDLVYGSVDNFNKYSLLNFNELSSIDSKFDTINKFYKDLLRLNGVKSKNKNTKQKNNNNNCVKSHYCFIKS